MTPGQQEIEERRAGTTHVEIARRRGSEADAESRQTVILECRAVLPQRQAA
jgi:hypothetical protein